ncbi:hypothetical protein QYF36_025657 [Acer negundo]|nr:hypothetical protein QYF36_025657 [Acer negundo]
MNLDLFCSCQLKISQGRGHDVDNDDEEDHHEEIAGGNVHLITTMANWEAKLSESIKDDKICSLEFSNSWGIKATPTFFFLKEGRQVDKLIGANKLELERKAAAATNLSTKTCN